MWRHSNARDQRAGFEAHLQLARDTAGMLDEYRADGIDFEMHRTGLLMAFAEQENLEHHRAHLDLVRQFGLDPQVLVGDDVRIHEPLLSDRVRGGIFFPHERHLDPSALVQGLHKRLLERGVRVLESEPATGVTVTGPRRDRRVTGLVTSTAVHEGDAFVLAAGAWTGPLSAAFGHRLPVRPGKGYSIDVPPVRLRGATNLSDAKVAVTPFTDRLRLAGTMEFAGLDEDVNDLRVRAILRAPAVYLRDWEPPAGRLQPRAGMRPMTPDGLAAIGRLPGTTNAFVSSGHGMLGVTLAAGSARALTELVVHGVLPPQLVPFDPSRFNTARQLAAVRRAANPRRTSPMTPRRTADERRTADLQGILAAVTTPFTPDAGSVDEAALQAQTGRLIAAGIHGLVTTGTTGEFPTLTPQEYRRVIEALRAGRRRPGTGGRRCRGAVDPGAVELAQHTERVGADAVMLLPPSTAASTCRRYRVPHRCRRVDQHPDRLLQHPGRDRYPADSAGRSPTSPTSRGSSTSRTPPATRWR